VHLSGVCRFFLLVKTFCSLKPRWTLTRHLSYKTMLQSPSFGGDAIWANQHAALELVSPAMRKIITPLSSVQRGFQQEAVHPVIRTHPETGREALYVNGSFTKRFKSMTIGESKPIFDYLESHVSRPDLTTRHTWSVGDIVMWDYRCVMHYAVHDYGDLAREMHRVTVKGERPA